MNKISIICPCYNEEDNVTLFYKEFVKVKSLGNYDYEIIFIDDGSRDATFKKIEECRNNDRRVKGISFSRNFGKEAAIFAGLRNCQGDCCIVIDVDLQHPLWVIPQMVEKWEEGYEIVEGVKQDRGKEGIIHKAMAKIFYRIISNLVGVDMANSSDFKLLDRKVIESLSTLKERNTFFRALSFWMGYRSISIPFFVEERKKGHTKWSSISLIKYGLRNIVSFTYLPLYFIMWIGGGMLIFSLFMGVDSIISFLQGNSTAGYPSLILLIVTTSGCIILCLGIIGVYIAKIYDEIKQRPQYIINQKI